MRNEAKYTPLFVLVKLLDIGLVTMYFFILGLAAAKTFDGFLGKFDQDGYENNPLWLLFLEIVLQLFFIGIVAYILRNLVKLIPYPLDGVAGFQHTRLKELDGGEVMALVLILFQRNLIDKVFYFVNRLLGISVTHSTEEVLKGTRGSSHSK